jgi:hypothetical protein
MTYLQFTQRKRCWKRCPSTRRYLSQLIVSLKNRHNNSSCTYSSPDTNFHGMEQHFVGSMWIPWTSVAIILRIYVSLQVKPRFITKNVNCGSISPLATDCKNQLQKWTLLAGSRGCKACTHYRCSSPARRFSDFLGVCSSLAPTSCNVSSALGVYVLVSCLLRVPLISIYSPNCELSAKYSFMKCLPKLSSISVFLVGVIQKYTLL